MDAQKLYEQLKKYRNPKDIILMMTKKELWNFWNH